jgi:hypothetical protein
MVNVGNEGRIPCEIFASGFCNSRRRKVTTDRGSSLPEHQKCDCPKASSVVHGLTKTLFTGPRATPWGCQKAARGALTLCRDVSILAGPFSYEKRKQIVSFSILFSSQDFCSATIHYIPERRALAMHSDRCRPQRLPARLLMFLRAPKPPGLDSRSPHASAPKT